jgi:hypothetical protein
MEKILDEQLLDYLDGTLSSEQSVQLEKAMEASSQLKARLEELRHLHLTLRAMPWQNQPSLHFTSHGSAVHSSPRNGLLLLVGILIAVGIALVSLQSGMFDTLNGVLSLDRLIPNRPSILPQSLPSIPISGKLLLNGFVVAATCVCFVLLDRTILRPYFNNRTSRV